MITMNVIEKEIQMTNLKWKESIGLTVIGLIAGVLAAFYQLDYLTPEIEAEIVAALGNVNLLIPVSAVQVAVLTFVASLFGFKMRDIIGLKVEKEFKVKYLLLALFIGAISATLTSLADFLVFKDYISPDLMAYKFSWTYLLSGILYGGIVEELIVRLLIMSILAWLINKFVLKNQERPYNNKVFMLSNVLAALVFAVGHLPATIQILGLSTPIIIRMLLLNGVPGLLFGYLYWKKGLKYAMIAHMFTHIFNQLVVMPLLFS